MRSSVNLGNGGIKILLGQSCYKWCSIKQKLLPLALQGSANNSSVQYQEELPSSGFPAVDESELLEDTLEESSSS